MNGHEIDSLGHNKNCTFGDERKDLDPLFMYNLF